MSMSKKVTTILTIAGTDSGGGAGIQADLRTISAHECYGTSVVTAVTAQNTTGVQGVHGVPHEFVAQQMSSVLDDIDIHAIKTGMLFTAENTRAISSTLREYFRIRGRVPLVCDPVCVSTSGHVLLQPDAVDTVIDELFPLSTLITPNRREAELLLGARSLPCRIASLNDMLVTTKNLLDFGSEAVLLKGGHFCVSLDDIHHLKVPDGATLQVKSAFLLEDMDILRTKEAEEVTDIVVDVLCRRGVDVITLYPRPRLQSNDTHGTGCTLSAALACELGNGASVEAAVARATAYTHLAIETAPSIGRGSGPVNHLHSVSRLVVPPRTPALPYPLTHNFIQSTAELWKAFVRHEFVVQVGEGTLDKSSFIHFLKQDYLYLKYYARAYAILAAKSHSDFTAIASAAKVVLSISAERSLHSELCARFGITLDELERTPESPATTAYGAFLIDVGIQGDAMKLLVVLAACLLGYGQVGLWLKKEAGKSKSGFGHTWVKWEPTNPYLLWMEDYAGSVYQEAVVVGLELIEARAAEDPPSPMRYAEWLDVWKRCVQLEKEFWDMAMNQS